MSLINQLRHLTKLPSRLPQREKRFLIIGGIASALIVTYSMGLDPLLKKQDGIRKEIVLKQKSLLGYERYVSRHRPLERKITTFKQKLEEMEKGLLDSNNPSLAAARIQDTIKELSLKTGVSINSVRVMPPAPVDIYTEIPVRIETTGNVSSLKSLLFEIESFPKLLIIKEINVNVQSWNVPRRPPVVPLPRRADARGAAFVPPVPKPVTDFRTALVICGYIKPATTQGAQPSVGQAEKKMTTYNNQVSSGERQRKRIKEVQN